MSEASDTYNTDYHFWACALFSFSLTFLFMCSCLFHSFFMLPQGNLTLHMIWRIVIILFIFYFITYYHCLFVCLLKLSTISLSNFSNFRSRGDLHSDCRYENNIFTFLKSNLCAILYSHFNLLFIYLFFINRYIQSGSYTPYLLIGLHQYTSALVLLSAVWTVAIGGSVFSGIVFKYSL